MSAVDVATYGRRALPFRLSDGAIGILKWIAVMSMVADHVNAYVFENASVVATCFGRLAFPVFAVVFGYNLARTPRSHWEDVGLRLTIAGLVSQVPYVLMVGDAWRLNIFFTLGASLLILNWMASPTVGHRLAALATTLVGAGWLVDFQWYGLIVVLSAYGFAVRATARAGIFLMTGQGLLTLYLYRQIGWPALVTMLTIPLVLAVSRVEFPFPRWRWFFYAVYPAHISVLVAGVQLFDWGKISSNFGRMLIV